MLLLYAQLTGERGPCATTPMSFKTLCTISWRLTPNSMALRICRLLNGAAFVLSIIPKKLSAGACLYIRVGFDFAVASSLGPSTSATLMVPVSWLENITLSLVRGPPFTHYLNRNGPLPALTGPFPRLSPSFCTTAGESIIPERSVKVARSGENGFLSSKRTWEESTVTTDCTLDISLKRGDEGVDNIRLMLNTTASALKGVPSWNFT